MNATQSSKRFARNPRFDQRSVLGAGHQQSLRQPPRQPPCQPPRQPPRQPRCVATGRPTLLLTLLLAGGLLAAPATAHAWTVRGDFTGQSDQFVNTAAGAVSSAMATTGTHLRLSVEPTDSLGVDLSWHPFHTQSATLGGIYAEATADIVTVGATWRGTVASWLRPFVRGAAGVGTTWVSLNEGVRATGRVTAPALAGGVGIELLVPPGKIIRGHDFSVGFLIEFGWMHVFQRDLTLDVDRVTTPATTPTTIQAGALGWSAFTTRFGLVVRI